jgi:hypothetical protein
VSPACAAPARIPLAKKLAFAATPLAAVLLLAEVIIRLARAPLHTGSFRELRLDQARRGYPAIRDDRLGYVPRAGAVSRANQWGTTITIDAHGLRSNGPLPPPSGRRVVAVGDSFTFGDQVSDHETWPAYLQERLWQPVLNAGVFGYSLAQAILRAEDVLARFDAEWLVVSFTEDDLARCELKKRYTSLPWFDVVDGGLVLCNVPVRDLSLPQDVRSRAFKNALAHSALLDALLAHTVRDWWIEEEKQVRCHPPGTGDRIGLLLVDRIVALCRTRGCRLLLVLQGERAGPAARALLARAREHAVPALDLVAAFEAATTRDPACRARWFKGHMTSDGNRWVALQIAATIAAAR